MNHLSLCAVAIGALLLPKAAGAAEATSKQQCVAANDSGQDLVQAGKLREARTQFEICAAVSCPGIVRDDCSARLRDVAASIPTVVFHAVDGDGLPLSAVRVTVDGAPLVDRLDGLPVDVDPGSHLFVFTTTVAPPVERTIVIRDKGQQEQVLIGRPAPKKASAHTEQVLIIPGDTPKTETTDTQRWVGLSLGGAGVLGLGIGSVMALVANSTYHNALQNECTAGDHTRCSDAGIAAGKTANSQALVSTMGFVGGSALLGAGAYLYFTAPKTGVSLRPQLGAGTLGLQAVGAW